MDIKDIYDNYDKFMDYEGREFERMKHFTNPQVRMAYAVNSKLLGKLFMINYKQTQDKKWKDGAVVILKRLQAFEIYPDPLVNTADQF